MLFGLKNAEATYQRLVNKNFHQQIGKNMEVCVDDLLVKSRTTDTFITNLREVFQILWSSRMMLNPKKCIFSVKLRQLIRYLVSSWGIEATPDNVKAI